jgi:SP family sugar:H+ symporter-like MFS transporter
MLTFLAVLLGAIASMGGFIFGYESGQISGTSLSTVTRLRFLQVLTGE